MWFEIICLLFMAFLCVFSVYCYRLGLKDGAGTPETPKQEKKKPANAQVVRDKYDDILDNINAYDGSGANQKDVTV